MTAAADFRAVLDDPAGPASTVTITVPGASPQDVDVRAVLRQCGGRPPAWAGEDTTPPHARWAEATVHPDDLPAEPVRNQWKLTDASGTEWTVKDTVPRHGDGGAVFCWRLALLAGQRGGAFR